jgi:hypothetical protein
MVRCVCCVGKHEKASVTTCVFRRVLTPRLVGSQKFVWLLISGNDTRFFIYRYSIYIRLVAYAQIQIRYSYLLDVTP